MRRGRMSRKSSKRRFSKTASRSHRKNTQTVMRGGFRI